MLPISELNQAKESNFDRIKTLIEANAGGYTAEHVGVLIQSLVDAVNSRMPKLVSTEKEYAIETELLIEHLEQHTTPDNDVTLNGGRRYIKYKPAAKQVHQQRIPEAESRLSSGQSKPPMTIRKIVKRPSSLQRRNNS